MDNSNKTDAMKRFNRFTIILGTITLGIGAITSLIPGFWLSSHFDIPVTFGEVMSAFLPLVAIFGISWFTDGLVYYPIIGLAGTYLGWLTGNVTNLRVPCSVASQLTAGVQEGTDEGGIISVISIAVSSFVTIVVLGISAASATVILSIIPESLQVGFDFLMPALMGALCLQFGLRNLKILLLAFVIVIIINLFLNPYIGLPVTWNMLLTVFATILIAMYFYNKGKKNGKTNNKTEVNSSEE
ncbi:MAG: hypothetical protein AB7V48_16850 [Sedimentibacter sp.]